MTPVLLHGFLPVVVVDCPECDLGCRLLLKQRAIPAVIGFGAVWAVPLVRNKLIGLR